MLALAGVAAARLGEIDVHDGPCWLCGPGGGHLARTREVFWRGVAGRRSLGGMGRWIGAIIVAAAIIGVLYLASMVRWA